MTPKQEERVRTKISRIKAALAQDKKHWGGYYHDGRGLRYLPLKYYIQLSDYTGGLRYLNWFKKNFSDDAGLPEFLFEWTIILFMTGRRKEAGLKAFQTFCSNTYLFDKFFGRPIIPIDKWEGSNVEIAEYVISHFEYSHEQAELKDFSVWLMQFTESDKFILPSNKYIDIHKRLLIEHDYEIRHDLVEQASLLENGLYKTIG